MPELTTEQVNFFHENGYLVIENFWNEETVNGLKQRMSEILANCDESTSKTIFTTGEDQTSHADDYFLGSSDKIRYFWEKDAWTTTTDENNVTTKTLVNNSVSQSINKVGHAIHDLDDKFRAVSYAPRIGRIARELGLVQPIATQSMYIFKQPRIGGGVGAHQDGSYLFTEPQSVLGFWWALDKCTKDNGCLWAVPGSHRMGVLRQYRRKEGYEAPVADDTARNGNGSGSAGRTEYYPEEPENFDLSQGVALEIPAGSLVLIHHAVVHYSEPNTSVNPRHAYSIHVVDGAPGVVYSDRNWLQRPPSMPFRTIPADDEQDGAAAAAAAP